MKKKNLFQCIRMSLSEAEEYYKELRKYHFEQKTELKNIIIREKLYFLFAGFIRLDRLLRRECYNIMGKREKVHGQVIYACTHIGGNDLQCIFEAIGRGCWWFIGDPCVLYKDISGLLLHLNGCIMLDTGDKTDRNIAYLRALELLERGGSLMIYPEGARNGTENIPVMDLYQGTARMAYSTMTKVVPVAIEQYGSQYTINFGEEIYPDNFLNSEQLTQKIRDELATLKWEIWEKEGVQNRSNLPQGYRETFIREFEKRIYPYDTLESVERTRYHTKADIEHKEFLLHLQRITPNKNNAFLFKKK